MLAARSWVAAAGPPPHQQQLPPCMASSCSSKTANCTHQCAAVVAVRGKSQILNSRTRVRAGTQPPEPEWQGLDSDDMKSWVQNMTDEFGEEEIDALLGEDEEAMGLQVAAAINDLDFGEGEAEDEGPGLGRMDSAAAFSAADAGALVNAYQQGQQEGPDTPDGGLSLQLAQPADEDAEDFDDQEGEDKYPPLPKRSFYIADLFGTAAYYDAAQMLEEKYPEVGVYGLQSDASKVQPGDMYCCSSSDPDQLPQLVQQALQQGAFSLLLPSMAQSLAGVQELIPQDLPAFYVDNVDEAAARLAVAFYEAPSREMLMVGVVGTHGKTTTAWLIRGILEEMEQVTGMMGDIELSIAEDRLDPDGQLWSPSAPDPTEKRECSAPFMVTPYPQEGKYSVPSNGLSGLQTQKVLAGMRDRGAGCCVFEASPTTIGRGRLAWVESTVLVHTTLMPMDAGQGEQTGSAAAQRREQELQLQAAMHQFERLDDPKSQAVVINLDDGAAELVRRAAGGVPAVTYSRDKQDADVTCENIKYDIWEAEVIVRTPMGRLQIISPLLGEHNISNILAAVATGIALQVPLKSIVAGIEAVEIIPGRCELVDEGQDFSVIVDCADTPQALESMLTSLSKAKTAGNRIITVFGCKGEEDRALRPQMAEVAHALSDVVILTNDSPRREPPENIIQDVVAGLPDSIIKRYSGYVYFPFQDQGHVPLWFEPYLQKAQRTCKRYVMEDRFSAIRAAIGTAMAGDVVLIAGRGHCDFMEYDDGQDGIVRGWFDDRLEARSALSKLAYLNQLTRLNRKQLPWGNALEEMDTLIDPPWNEKDEMLGGAPDSEQDAMQAQEPLPTS